MAYKRSSKKTGSTTRVTTTKSSKGTKFTHSTKGSLGGKNTRTHSRSWTKDGRLRMTTTWLQRAERIAKNHKLEEISAPYLEAYLKKERSR